MQPKSRPSYRVERPRTLEVHDETGHLWAVSYADLLMVLLSFFILFFSSAEKKQDIIQKLLPAGNFVQSDSSSTAPVEGASTGALEVEIATISGLTVEHKSNSSVLTIQFPPDIYSVGGSELSAEHKQRLLDVFSKLRPYLSQLQVEIVGHTDASPLVKKKSKYMQDNMDLSFFRASQALRYILNKREIAVAQISAKGAGSQSLANRTLSITIRPKGNQP